MVWLQCDALESTVSLLGNEILKNNITSFFLKKREKLGPSRPFAPPPSCVTGRRNRARMNRKR